MIKKQADWPRTLARWYEENGKAYPWRQDCSPYTVWISEIMLQQTRIEAVLGYYSRFMEAFPTVQALAEAPEETVLKLWEGLGYYSRARNLHKAAQLICRDYGSEFPCRYEEIRKLPGIGDYTAGAIAAIAFGQPCTAIDGNVMRVTARLCALEEDILLPATRKKVKALLEDVYPTDAASAFVQGLMELGEQVCIPGTPRCGDCPVKESCQARALGRTEELPLRKKKEKQRVQPRLVALIRRNGQVLLHRRGEKGVLAGLWEYPGVDGTDPGQMEELFREQLGLQLMAGEHLLDAEHVFTHIRWQMSVYEARLLADPPAEDFCWATEEQLEKEIMLPTAFRRINAGIKIFRDGEKP